MSREILADAAAEHVLPGGGMVAPRNFEVRPKTGRDGAALDSDLLEVSMGPHHPSTHGVFRMDVVLDGEIVVKLKPVFGYLHRNHEKIAEGTSYLASMPSRTGWIISARSRTTGPTRWRSRSSPG